MSVLVDGLPPDWATAAIPTGSNIHQYPGASAVPANPTSAVTSRTLVARLPPRASVARPDSGEIAAAPMVAMVMSTPICVLLTPRSSRMKGARTPSPYGIKVAEAMIRTRRAPNPNRHHGPRRAEGCIGGARYSSMIGTWRPMMPPSVLHLRPRRPHDDQAGITGPLSETVAGGRRRCADHPLRPC